VFADGLAVHCANLQQQCFEVGFVADDHSPVDLCIFRRSTGAVVGNFACPEGEQFRIEVRKTNPVGIGSFYMDSRAYEDDFLWMPDLEKWHSAPVTIQANAKNALSAKLVIRDGLYHTALLSESRALRTSSSGRFDRLPALGRILGADITCESADLGVDVVVYGLDAAGQEVEVFKRFLDKQDGPFVVCVGTKALKDHDSLGILYDQVLDPTSERFSIQYEQKEPEWVCCGLVGNSGTKDSYPMGSQQAGETPDSVRVFFATLKDALDANYNLVGAAATEYACQSYGGGGGGPLPDLP
jgi:hypothetical protein